jgi:preprotein translocase subunit SecG
MTTKGVLKMNTVNLISSMTIALAVVFFVLALIMWIAVLFKGY